MKYPVGTKREVQEFLQPFVGKIRVLIKGGDGNDSLMPINIEYKVKHGVLRLADGSLLEDGDSYLEVST